MTIKELIEQMGGPADVSRELKLPETTVRSWVARGSLPSWRVGSVAGLAKRKGIAVQFEDLFSSMSKNTQSMAVD